MNTICIRYCIALCYLTFTSLSSSAQTDHTDKARSIFGFISEENVLHLSIKTDINKLFEIQKNDDTQKAELTFSDLDEDYKNWDIKNNVRGKFRRRHYDFPPLRIKFKKSHLKDRHLEPYTSLKLVTHCTDKAASNELLLKEHLVYKLYNIITEQSFRAQLMKIDWIDKRHTHNLGSQWGFLIEDKDELEDRLQLNKYEENGALSSQLNAENAAICYLFQYMIGNHDWIFVNGQNMHYMRIQGSEELVAVASDFDFSVLVEAFYSTSAYPLPQNNKRAYMGHFNKRQNLSCCG